MLRERMGSIMKCLEKSAVFCLMVILGAGLTACGGDKKEKEEEKVLFDSVKFPEALLMRRLPLKIYLSMILTVMERRM